MTTGEPVAPGLSTSAGRSGPRPGPDLFGGRRSDGRRPVLIAVASTVVVFGLLAAVIVNAPGWPTIQETFFNPKYWDESWPNQVSAIVVNIQAFLIAEVLILPFALVIAILRSLPGPVFFPIRLMATIYADFFRGVPGVVLIFLIGFGVPTLGFDWLPNDPFVFGIIVLVLIYTAYVSEVYRAGIESIHPSQAAAARSLGLSHVQALRYVVIPQAIRRVVPPLLNDFIGLQKDTALISFIGVIEVFRQAQIDESASFNFTPYMVTAVLFLILTIPLARTTDWLVARERRRQLATMAR
ncbi:MAG: amino acid ABC transporter permease [Candidatus Limnocylindrales bacterium]